MFAEVKNVETDPLDGEHVELCRGLARATGRPVILLTGAPHWRPYNQVRPDSAPNEFLAVFFRASIETRTTEVIPAESPFDP